MGSVIFCNHRSNADPWICSWVCLSTGSDARFVYKSSLNKVPVIGYSVQLTGDLPAHFGDREKIKVMLERTKELLSNGVNVCVFPEGTRSPSGLLQDFKPTFFQICAELGCPAVPLCLLGTEQAWPHGGMKVGCAQVAAVLGEPIAADQTGGEGLKVKVAKAMQDLARFALGNDAIDKDDPLLTGKPYAWWIPPKELQGLSEDQQIQLLRSGKSHARGKNLF